MAISSPLVFLPGTLCDERLWISVWRSLPPCQRSYVPLQWANTREEMLSLCQDRIDAFDQPVHLIGYSMGGFIASLTAIENPSKVRALHLVNYSPRGLQDAELAQRKQVLSMLKKSRFTGLNDSQVDQYIGPKQRNQSDIRETIYQMSVDLGGATLAAHISSTTPREDLCKPLGSLKAPVYYYGAKHDHLALASDIASLASLFAKPPFMEPDCGHMLPLEAPDKLAEALLANLDQ